MEVLTHRTCTRCRETKPVAEMVASKKYRGGYMPFCKPCRNDYWRELRASSPERNRSHIDAVLRSKLLTVYGMRPEDYERMVAEHDDRCALCNTNDTGRGARFRTWNIDHCHETNRVRGLLCHDCNIKLGHYEWFMKHVGEEKMKTYLANDKYSAFKWTRKNRPSKSSLKDIVAAEPKPEDQ